MADLSVPKDYWKAAININIDGKEHICGITGPIGDLKQMEAKFKALAAYSRRYINNQKKVKSKHG